MLGIIGRKRGMTQIFNKAGIAIPVTVVEAGPCVVSELKTKEGRAKYDAVKLAFDKTKENRLNKASKGQFTKNGLELHKFTKEFRVESTENFKIGQQMTVGIFQVGDQVDVQGTSKGRGFQGVMKKEGKHGGPDSHGSGFHRRPGSIGMRTWPGRVFKNMGMPGRMGGDLIMVRNLNVVEVREEENVLLLEGAVPGHKNGLVYIYNRDEKFLSRIQSAPETKTEEAAG